MDLTLRALSLLDGEREWLFLQELEWKKNGFGNDGHGIPFEDFPSYLLKHIKSANRVDLPVGIVPQTTYWLTDGNLILGLIKLRHYLTEGLLEHGGHIGYAVHPDHRGKGYGKRMLALILEKARLKGLDSVLLTCNQDNYGSRSVIEANGGRLWKESEKSRWYWIDL